MSDVTVLSQSHSDSLLGALTDVLFAERLQLVVVSPKGKRPYPHPKTRSWWRVQTLGEMEEALVIVPSCNLSVDCTASGLVQVDPDSDEALAWGTAHGLTSDGAWSILSARGTKALYRAPGVDLPPAWNDKNHLTTDIGNRLCLVPPSIHPSGLPLRWVSGHSPADIPKNELADLPGGLLQAWRDLKGPKPMKMERTVPPPGWLGLVFDAIVHYMESRGGRLRPSGNGGLVGLCPLHDDRDPSFSIHPVKGWKCFSGCGHGRLTILAHRLGISLQDQML
jgi:hypothetical protein